MGRSADVIGLVAGQYASRIAVALIPFVRVIASGLFGCRGDSEPDRSGRRPSMENEPPYYTVGELDTGLFHQLCASIGDAQHLAALPKKSNKTQCDGLR